jgi:hypothetical protein
MLVEILLFIAACLTIAYLVLILNGKPPSYQGDTALYKLEAPESLALPSKFAPWDGRPCTIRFAIYIQQAPKTLSKVDCIDTATPLTQFGPSCKDYTFKACKCNGTVCKTCDMQSSYLSKVLYVGDALELWASGYTSTNDKPLVPALLKIKTAQDSNNFFIESISLPAIPLQRWTVITIVKEGRRYDVYYGSKVVASKLLDYVPISPSGADWRAGGMKNWIGKIGLFTGTMKSASQDDVNSDVEALVNTRGIPFYLDQLNFSFDIQMPTCIFGNCNTLPTVKPLNPFAVYATNVQ